MNAVEHLLGDAALACHGGRVALVCGEDAVTYAQLAHSVQRAAGAYGARGVASGERVLIVLRDTPEFVAAWLGALWRGAVAIAVNTTLSEDEYRYLIQDSGAKLLVIEDRFVPGAAELVAELGAKGRVVVVGSAPGGMPAWHGLTESSVSQTEPRSLRPDDPAFWLYSSGTTDQPKGIIHAHKDLRSTGKIQREALKLVVDDKVFVTSKLFFAYALENGVLGPLALCATIVLHADWCDPELVCMIVSRERPAAFFSVPSFYRRPLTLPADMLDQFRAVWHFVSAGERLPDSVVGQWRQAVGNWILSAYGTSETFCVCMITAQAGGTSSRPLADVDIRLRTSEGAEALVGEPGVLWIRHSSLSSGNANRQEVTHKQFVDGWFCSNDVFVRDATGHFLHQGRSDEFIKVAGQWVQPADVEGIVTGLSSVADAACVPVKDADGFERLALFIAAHGDELEAVRAAQTAYAERLPRHKRPKWVRALAELPRTATGKIRRFKLRDLIEREFVDQN